jgi:phytoene/squalene synthetase
MDLHQQEHDRDSFSDYVLGSAEAVGLMCLRVFTEGDRERYDELEPYARSLGAAFQKVNFLRDLNEDRKALGRDYFPQNNGSAPFDRGQKQAIESEIASDFSHAYKGIVRLPRGSRFGVYVAYVYYKELFRKIQRSSPERIEQERIRIPNFRKGFLFLASYLRYRISSL